MIYTVTFNPSIDYIVNVDNFMTGVVNRTSKEIIFPGGKGINVSMVLKNLGQESTALGFMAGFTGDAITRLLQEKGVTADFIHVTEGLSRINVKLRAQTETEINGQGPKIASEDIRKLYGKLDALQDGDTLVLAGSIPDTMPESMYMDIMEHLQNKKLNIVVDATRDLLMNVLAYHPFLIKPNNHELGEIFHTVINDKDDVVTYAKRMQEKGARNVLVSMAGDGAVLVTEDGQEFRADAPKGKLVNSVHAFNIIHFLSHFCILLHIFCVIRQHRNGVITVIIRYHVYVIAIPFTKHLSFVFRNRTYFFREKAI